MDQQHSTRDVSTVTLTGVIITLGIVYGDLGTSPLYTMQAIVGGLNSLDPLWIIGSLSCIIWTLTLQTTVKYIIITLKADNKGEGGIFALFAIIRKKAPWTYILAIVGGSALLADGIITPSITVTSAVEGLSLISKDVPVVPIVLIIITALFVIQQFGTRFLGKSFGPIMFFWFLMLGIFGVTNLVHYPAVFKAFNPVYAFRFLSEYPGAFVLLGAVFLATTGAEALYSDLGHCGIKNIRISWIYVKTMLILNYLGQGAWVLTHDMKTVQHMNPFFGTMPGWFWVPGVLISTAAAVIASQALISGSFTLISEAISLNFWPKQKLGYPTEVKGQVYVGSINWFLWVACLFVVVHFGESKNMEAAYGLSINLTMIMTTFLLMWYLYYKKFPIALIVFIGILFSTIEFSFLIANLHKFALGGYFTLFAAFLFSIIMYAWYNGRKIKNRFLRFLEIDEFLPVLNELSKDVTVPKFATHLIYISKANYNTEIESKIIYSIINKQPKRADVYWFLHVDILDEPDVFKYDITHFIPGKVIKVDFRLGFKIEPRINLYFKQVLDEMVKENEVDLTSRYDSLHKYKVQGDLQFVLIDRVINYDYDYTAHEKFVLNLYELIRNLGISEVESLGLDTSNVLVEKVPLTITQKFYKRLKRSNGPVH